MKKDGTARKGKEGGVPENRVVCGQCGGAGDGCGHGSIRHVVTVAAPLLICAGCAVRYDGSHSEYNKFFQVGTVGRATATDVLVEGMLNGLDKNLKPQVMAFTDNQQDSSFQAAHLRSMSRRFHFRRAVIDGLRPKNESSPVPVLDTSALATAAFDAMKDTGTLPTFARETTATIDLLANQNSSLSASRYLRYLKAGVLMETSGGPRKAQPNLEDTGLVVVGYSGLNPDAVIAAITGYEAKGELDNLKAYADRRSRPRRRPPTRHPRRDAPQPRAGQQQRPRPGFRFQRPPPLPQRRPRRDQRIIVLPRRTDLPMRPSVYDERQESKRSVEVRRLAGRVKPDGADAPQTTTLTRWLRREIDPNMASADAKTLIREAHAFLRLANLVATTNGGSAVVRGPADLHPRRNGERLPVPPMRSPMDLHQGRNCPRCVRVALREDRPGRDDFFRRSTPPRSPTPSAWKLKNTPAHSTATPANASRPDSSHQRTPSTCSCAPLPWNSASTSAPCLRCSCATCRPRPPTTPSVKDVLDGRHKHQP